MNGMRVKGIDLNTDFGELKTASKEVELPLARVQNSMFERSSAIGKKSDIMSDEDIAESYENFTVEEADMKEGSDRLGYITLSFPQETAQEDSTISTGFIIYDSGEIAFDDWLPEPIYMTLVNFIKSILVKEKSVRDMSQKDIEDKLLSMGYTSVNSKKKAVYFDGYSYRVTIESLAGDNNQNYSFIINMLAAADIRYREVRRYTIEPDRVLLDILIKKEDVDVINELDKEGKEYDVSFTFDNNISEGVQPKTIVTPEKEVQEKVKASKKKATTTKQYMNPNTGSVDTIENWKAEYEATDNKWEWFGIATEDEFLLITDNGDNPLYWDNDLKEVEKVGGEWKEVKASKKTV